MAFEYSTLGAERVLTGSGRFAGQRVSAEDAALDAKLAEMFPEDDPGVEPTGVLLIVQERSPKSKTAGGIHLLEETQDYEQAATAIAKVIAVGELCFTDIESGKHWAGPDWCKPGDYVIVPKLCDTKWRPTRNGVESKAIYRTVKDKQIIGVVRDRSIIPDFKMVLA